MGGMSEQPSGDACETDADCDNGLFCDGAEVCSDGFCAAGDSPTASDEESCVIAECDEATDSVFFFADNSLCDNGDVCDGVERCDVRLGCVAGIAPAPDGVNCF